LIGSNGYNLPIKLLNLQHTKNDHFMKTTLYLSLILLAIVFVACRSQKAQSSSEPIVVMEDHASTTYEFPAEGTYYTYQFEEETPYDFDETPLISALLEAGIRPLDIWYKGGSSMCVPPGSDIGMTVIVEPGMLVRLANPSDKMAALGFIVPEEPNVGGCAYRVRHYQYSSR
jgi:hypothetical protein